MAKTYAYALAGGLIATFTVTPALSAYLLPEYLHETDTLVVRWLHALYAPVLRFAIANRLVDGFIARRSCDLVADFSHRYPVEVLCNALGIPDEDIKVIELPIDEFTILIVRLTS